MSKVELGTIYDFNKNLVQKTQIQLSEKILNDKKKTIEYFLDNTIGNYYMLLCNEKKDYTVFDFKENRTIERYADCAKCLVDECLKNRGEIRGIDITEDKTAIEIWMSIDNESYVYYFFPYENGVIVDF